MSTPRDIRERLNERTATDMLKAAGKGLVAVLRGWRAPRGARDREAAREEETGDKVNDAIRAGVARMRERKENA